MKVASMSPQFHVCQNPLETPGVRMAGAPKTVCLKNVGLQAVAGRRGLARPWARALLMMAALPCLGGSELFAQPPVAPVPVVPVPAVPVPVAPAPAVPTLTAPPGTVPGAPAVAPASKEPKDVVAGFNVAYSLAFNQQKLEDLGSLWRVNGVYSDETTGVEIKGRDQIQQSFAEIFANNPKAVLNIHVQAIRPVTQDVIIVDGIAITTVPDEDPISTDYEAVLVQENGKWLLDQVKESESISGPAVLQGLGWLVGNWQDDSEDVTIRTSVRWSSQKAFLIRSYHVSFQDETTYEGTQVIGWDPNQKTIRSWNFESDGGFGQGVWTQHGSTWTIRNTMTLGDGKTGSSRQIINVESDDAYTIETVGLVIGGVPFPSLPEVRVLRNDGDDSEAATTSTTQD